MNTDKAAELTTRVFFLINNNLDLQEQVKSAGWIKRKVLMYQLRKQAEGIAQILNTMPRELFANVRLQWVMIGLGHLSRPPEVTDDAWTLMVRVSRHMLNVEDQDDVALMNKFIVEGGFAADIESQLQKT